MLLKSLEEQKRIHPPKWLTQNTIYMTYTGSIAYGCNDENSDADVYGFCIPPKIDVFPHLAGEILGFGTQKKRFDQWQEAHIKDSEGGEWDFSIYSIVRYFQLVMEGNPNMVDTLFTDRTCVIHSTAISELVRQHRKIFLSKKCYHTFKGYAYAQINKMKLKNPEPGSKRAEYVEKFGFDVKFGYHLVRLCLELEQILLEGDVDLRRDREIYKSIRRGEWSMEKIFAWFQQKESYLDNLYQNSDVVPYKPDEERIKRLLLECLEYHYGSLDKYIVQLDKYELAIKQIQDIVGKL